MNRDDYDIDDAWPPPPYQGHPVNWTPPGEPAPFISERHDDRGAEMLRMCCAYLFGFGVGVLFVLVAWRVVW